MKLVSTISFGKTITGVTAIIILALQAFNFIMELKHMLKKPIV